MYERKTGWWYIRTRKSAQYPAFFGIPCTKEDRHAHLYRNAGGCYSPRRNGIAGSSVGEAISFSPWWNGNAANNNPSVGFTDSSLCAREPKSRREDAILHAVCRVANSRSNEKELFFTAPFRICFTAADRLWDPSWSQGADPKFRRYSTSDGTERYTGGCSPRQRRCAAQWRPLWRHRGCSALPPVPSG